MRGVGKAAVVMLAAGALAAVPERRAEAAYTFSIAEIAGDVVIIGSGTLNLSGLSFDNTVVGCTCIEPFTGTLSATSGNFDLYEGVTGPVFGPGGAAFTAIFGGDNVYVSGQTGRIGVPVGYVSGTPLATDMAFTGATIASLGLTPGTYVFSWGGQTFGDTLTIQVEGVPVPEPATALLFGAGLLGLAASRRRR